jgi:curli biogenesis system outer membrane secretion channel CsgG
MALRLLLTEDLLVSLPITYTSSISYKSPKNNDMKCNSFIHNDLHKSIIKRGVGAQNPLDYTPFIAYNRGIIYSAHEAWDGKKGYFKGEAMKKIFSLIIAAIMISACGSARAADHKPRVTVYGFESKASSGFWHDAKWDIGTGMGEMLVDALVNTHRFEVLERLNLSDITTEQDLVTHGRVSKRTGAKTGQLKGAEYIVRGTITEFDHRESGAGGGFTIKGFNIGARTSSAHVGGIIRIYDAVTGETYDSKRFQKKVPATGLTFGYSGSDLGGSLGGFKKTPLGKATHMAIADMVDFISSSIPLEPRETPDGCPNCMEEMAPGAKFCTNCGLQITDVACPECGKKLDAGTNFCPGCGAKVNR